MQVFQFNSFRTFNHFRIRTTKAQNFAIQNKIIDGMHDNGENERGKQE